VIAARGAKMAFTLKQALEFNKFTTGLAAAGLAYAATIGSEVPAVGSVSNVVKSLSTATVVAFAASVLFGTFVMGRAAKLNAKEDAYVDDKTMKFFGMVHSAALALGLILAGLLMLDKIWKVI
jgi:hypothetical protein